MPEYDLGDYYNLMLIAPPAYHNKNKIMCAQRLWVKFVNFIYNRSVLKLNYKVITNRNVIVSQRVVVGRRNN